MNSPKTYSKWQTVLFRSSVLIVVFASLLFLAASPPLPTESNGNNSCQATYPAKGTWKRAFLDPIDGGTCWSCPKGFKRSAASVKSNKACTGFVKATQKGKYGCKNKYGRTAFKDPRGGGQCWTCPSGYKRTAEAVTSSKACAKDFVFGPFSKATFKGKPGCNSGFKDAIYGGTCWTCPKGSKRTVYPVNQANACEQSKKAMFRGHHLGIKKMSNSAKSKIKSVTKQFANTNAKIMLEVNKIHKAVNGKYKSFFINGGFKNAIDRGNYKLIWNKIQSEINPLLNQIKKLQNTPQFRNLAKFKVLSFSVTAEAGAVIGGSVEQGIMIFFDNNGIRLKGFTEYGATVSSGAGLAAGVSVGLWKNTIDCGSGFGISVGFGVKDISKGGAEISVAGGIWIDPKVPCKGNWESLLTLDAIDGISFDLTVGVGASPIPIEIAASFTSQMIWQVNSSGRLVKSCKPCGGRGQDACSVTEKFPSCNSGLRENCGTCN